VNGYSEVILYASDFQGFDLELSDREIYNDIRSNCDITEILTIRPDATPEFFDRYEASGWDYNIEPGEVREIIVNAKDGVSNVVWLNVEDISAHPITQFGWTKEECEALGGIWNIGPWGNPAGPSQCFLPSSLAPVHIEVTDYSDYTCTVTVENLSEDYPISIFFHVAYLALSSEKRYLKLRSINEESIAKYGRRTMDLDWPLGMHPTMMQMMIDNYRDRYSEPVCFASLLIEGKDDYIISQILSLKIDDRVRIIHDGLEMDEEFFVNNLSISHDVSGLLEGAFQLEGVRDSERLSFFIWDTSLLDEGDVWAP
jgi:hypothetical protein